MEVTILQRIPQLMNPLDYDMATFLHSHLRRKGMHLRLNTAVAGFRQEGETISALVEGGEAIPADLAILAIGGDTGECPGEASRLGPGKPGRDCGQPADGDLRP